MLLSAAHHFRSSNPRIPALILLNSILSTSLIGCGGGGGGGGDDSIPAPTPAAVVVAAAPETVPASISDANAADFGSSALSHSELVFEFGDATVRLLNQFTPQATYPTVTTCVGGTETNDFIDKDANHRLSVGDIINTTYSHCHDASIGGVVSGTVTVTVTDPTLSLIYETQWSGTIVFSNVEIILDDEPTVLMGLAGTIRFNSNTNITTSVLEVATPPPGFQISAQTNAKTLTEKVIIDSARKTVSYDQARYSFELDGIIQSQILGGSATVRISKPITGPLQNYPDGGELRLIGSNNTAASYVTGTGTSTGQATLTTSPQPSGTPYVGTLIPWADLSSGYLWADPLNPGSSYTMTPPAEFQFLYSNIPWTYPATTVTSANPTVRLQFSKAIDTTTLPRVTFTQQTNPGSGTVTDGDIEVRGALVLIKPRTQLKHGATYYLSPQSSFSDLDGAQLNISGWSFIVPNSLSARITASTQYGVPGTNVLLDGSQSTSTLSPITYRWQQLSGTPVTLSQTNVTAPSFTVPALSTTSLLVFQLTVTAPNGEVETDTFTYTAYPHTAAIEVLYYSSDTGDVVGAGVTRYVVSPPATRQLWNWSSIDNQFSASTGDYGLQLGGPNAGQLSVGHYAPAKASASAGDSYLNLQIEGRSCYSGAGHFDVLELTRDVYSQITIFAADFVTYCNGSPKALRGSIRIHSAIPITTNYQ